MKNVPPGTRKGTCSVLLSVSIIGTMFTFPQPERASGACNVFMFFHSPEAGIEVFEVLFFSYRIKHLRSDDGDVYSHLALNNKSFGVCI